MRHDIICAFHCTSLQIWLLSTLSPVLIPMLECLLLWLCCVPLCFRFGGFSAARILSELFIGPNKLVSCCVECVLGFLNRPRDDAAQSEFCEKTILSGKLHRTEY